MVGVQDENTVERTRHHRIGHVVLARQAEHHLQKIGAVIEPVVRVALRPTDGVGIARGRDHRHLRHQTNGRAHAVVRVTDVHDVVIERRQRPDDTDHDRHRVGVTAEATIKTHHLLVQHVVMVDGLLERRQLLGARQLTVHQQVGDLDEARALRKLAYRIAAVEQHALVAVHEGDGALARGGGTEAGIERQQAVTRVQRLNIHRRRPERTVEHGQAAVAVLVGDLCVDVFLAHGCSAGFGQGHRIDHIAGAVQPRALDRRARIPNNARSTHTQERN